ncbi:RCC1-like G exchanging factor-like protein [Liolophura sinensis]|uniref:RCC1-like G exchanging factor-like protein n=1 Tax=Liolophura sinensis TaxID=3198878 RepID=UPI00315952EF
MRGNSGQAIVCVQCLQCLRQQYVPVRLGSSWRKRVLKREAIKDRVIQYAGDTAHQTQRVYVWGLAATGALGIRSYLRPEAKGQRMLRYQPRPALQTFWDGKHTKVEDAACGYGFSVFMTKNRKWGVYGTGINTESQLGVHEYPRNTGRLLEYIIEPVRIDLPLKAPDTTRVKHVACGRAHTLILTDKEGVFSMGNNGYGQCGRSIIESEQYRGNPLIHCIAELPDNISQVICGPDHSFFLTETGQLYSCGLGADGQTGAGHFDCVGVPQLVQGDIQGETIVQVSCAGDCVLALSENGDVFGWGNSEYNQLSMVSQDTQVAVAKHLPMRGLGRVSMVASGGSICGVLNDKGSVFVWGYGILGKGQMVESSSAPTQIPDTLFGKHDFNTDSRVSILRSGLSYFAAITSSGDLYTWGKNRGGNLGLGQRNDQFFPFKVSVPAEVGDVRCGVDHMVALCKTFT